jgi:DNA-binding CsgD family transcriptional regulator
MVYLRRPDTDGPSEPEARETETARDPVAYNVTARQLECLAWAGEGKTAVEIGIILGISARTVEGHLAKICEAFGVRKRIQAVVIAREQHMLPSLRQ